MARIFAYIAHKGGVVDDSAYELAAAAKKIDANASCTAILTGWGWDLDAACNSLSSSFSFEEIWKVANTALAYPNAELVRHALTQLLPANNILLVAHDHFGIDLSPGLSIRLNSAFVSDVVGIDALEDDSLQLVRQEFGGQVSTHVRCDVSSGAVINIRPGAFKPQPSTPSVSVFVDKSSAIGVLTARRRYLHRTRHPGQRQCRACGRACGSAGRSGELLAARRRCQVDGEIAAGWVVGKNRKAESLSGLRHQRRLPASGRHQGKSLPDRDQQESQSPHLPGGRCRHRRRCARVLAGVDQPSPRNARPCREVRLYSCLHTKH